MLLCHHIWMTVMSFLLIWTDQEFHVCRLFRMQQYDFLLNLANTFIFTTVSYYVLQLPVDFRIWLKVLVLTFRSQNVQAPDYLCQLFIKHSAAHGLWSQAQSLLIVQHTELKTKGDRFSQSVAPKLWNSFSLQIYFADSVEDLK